MTLTLLRSPAVDEGGTSELEEEVPCFHSETEEEQ